MNDLISRSALLELVCCGKVAAEDIIKAPAVDAQPVRYGKWLNPYGDFPDSELDGYGNDLPF